MKEGDRETNIFYVEWSGCRKFELITTDFSKGENSVHFVLIKSTEKINVTKSPCQ